MAVRSAGLACGFAAVGEGLRASCSARSSPSASSTTSLLGPQLQPLPSSSNARKRKRQKLARAEALTTFAAVAEWATALCAQAPAIRLLNLQARWGKWYPADSDDPLHDFDDEPLRPPPHHLMAPLEVLLPIRPHAALALIAKLNDEGHDLPYNQQSSARDDEADNDVVGEDAAWQATH
jgi:hypothetical protein